MIIDFEFLLAVRPIQGRTAFFNLYTYMEVINERFYL